MGGGKEEERLCDSKKTEAHLSFKYAPEQQHKH
jgi:hypothetical protein